MTALLVELQTDAKVSLDRRSESRIPACIKYELSDGYRIVLQEIKGSDDLIALCVGTHEHVDSFLDAHKGWVFDLKTGKAREIRIATVEETRVDIVPSIIPRKLPEEVATGPSRVFAEFTHEMLLRIGAPESHIPAVGEISDPNSLEFMQFLEELEGFSPHAASLLLSYATGNSDSRDSVLKIAKGEWTFRAVPGAEEVASLRSASDEFVSFDDPADLQHVLEKGTFQEWQLFLHPDQRTLVHRRFQGPARIRGISGSGKTVVAIHRLRHLAKQHLSDGKKILFTTFNKALSKSAGHLVDSLCGQERSVIEVTHLHRWCLDFIDFRGLTRPRSTSQDTRAAQEAAPQMLPPELRDATSALPREYVWDEVAFLMGRFLHDEADGYLDTDRSGRGRPLQPIQRRTILELYQRYMLALRDRRVTDPAEFVRIAYRLRRDGQEARHQYAAVIVDEVQDISEIGLRLLHTLVGNTADGLLLVGDGTQRIFTRGFSMRGIGIDVTGRSVILAKNYRNTRQILEAAFPLVSGDWDEELSSAGVDPKTAHPIFSVRDGHRPAIVRCRREKDEGEFLRREIAYLLRFETYQPGSICVMARNSYYRDLAYNVLRAANIPIQHYQTPLVEEEPSEQEGVKVSSLHSAKGHEYAAVFVIGLVEGAFPVGTNLSPDELSNERTLLYVGMTRAVTSYTGCKNGKA